MSSEQGEVLVVFTDWGAGNFWTSELPGHLYSDEQTLSDLKIEVKHQRLITG